MIQDTDITAWLDGATLTAEQRDHFTSLVRAHETTIIPTRPGYGTDDYYSDDYADDDQAAWIAAYEIATGTLDLEARSRAHILARIDAYQGAAMAALAGESEVQAAARAGISRPKLRQLIGK